ncbi:MAG: DUF4465 domain-containing protein [Bacteroides sp.]|nr:DUF4465 domain-containing protein [Bacteroides sp.]
MKKLILPFFLLTFLFCVTSCDDDNTIPDPDETEQGEGNGDGDDDENEGDENEGDENEGDENEGDENEEKEVLVISFESLLTEDESEFMPTDGVRVGENDPYSYYITAFTDPQGILTFDHYYQDWGFGGGFTYVNTTDTETPGYNNLSAITAQGKNGKVYLTANTSSYTPAIVTMNHTDKYACKGVWITNTTYAYLAIKEGKDGSNPSIAKQFTNGDWFLLTAIGYTSEGEEIGSEEIYLADYRKGKTEILSEWTWFEFSEISTADYIKFELSSSDVGDWGMNTPAYFCMDGITLIEK